MTKMIAHGSASSARAGLLRRWRAIEEEEEEQEREGEDSSASGSSRVHQLKEQWFVDAFNFLISMPKENHIWCDSSDLMGPLLETFYNYYKDERDDSPLKLLWKRISEEMKKCIRCVSHHHQAQEMYSTEYELSSIGPLLEVLRTLDEERVATCLREINGRMAKQDPLHDNAEVVTVMYEVLMYPILLDNHSLFTEFEAFIEAIDDMHELALDGNQQLPGVYALLFCKRRVRGVAYRLASSMGKLRKAVDLEPLQPLLQKFFGFLETEVMPSNVESVRPGLQLDRVTLWLGIKSLLGFLEPPVLEEGILECYPIFFDVVLNQISGDSLVFSHAVTCLKILFEALGCKLWLRSSLPPSVMCSTLLGQSFHTRSEKIHKDIFELFQPFLQSLEALQDGDFEKQRRVLLYFLLHQVSHSSNFSILTKKKACQIALLVIHRGYKMNPPSPPFECSHMWGPSLVSCLKDVSLDPPLRQPATDLIQTIVVSDAAALVTSTMCTDLHPSADKEEVELNDDEDYNGPAHVVCIEKKDDCSWSEYSVQSTVVSQEYRGWMCMPMLWTDVLVETDPMVLPQSFFKAVLWSRSRLSFIEPGTEAEISSPIKTWLSSCTAEFSSSFGWKIPTGSDDGGDGKLLRNSVEAFTMYLPLLKTFNRLTAYFINQIGQRQLQKQWQWQCQPRMSESLILLLADPNDNVRHFGKWMLEEISHTQGLACGLKFLCSNRYSLAAVLLGLKHGFKLVRVDPSRLKFQTLHHFLFLLRKLLDCSLPASDTPEKSSSDSNAKKYSSQGGFLQQPMLEKSPENAGSPLSDVDLDLQEKFSYSLCQAAWPSLSKCLVDGKSLICSSFCQMTCVRILELLPVVFEKICPSTGFSGVSRKLDERIKNFRWLQDLMDWKKSSLSVVQVYWKRAVQSLLTSLKVVISDESASIVTAIEECIKSDLPVDEIAELVSRLSVSLSDKAPMPVGKAISSPAVIAPQGSPFEDRNRSSDVQPFPIRDLDTQILDLPSSKEQGSQCFVVLSDDETDEHVTSQIPLTTQPSGRNSYICQPKDKKSPISFCDSEKSSPQVDVANKRTSGVNLSKDLPTATLQKDNMVKNSATILSTDLPNARLRKESVKSTHASARHEFRDKHVDAPVKSKAKENQAKHIVSDFSSEDPFFSKNSLLKSLSTEKTLAEKRIQGYKSEAVEGGDAALNMLVRHAADELFESSSKSTKLRSSLLIKSSGIVPKRQVIQLNSTAQNRWGHSHRLEGGRRFKPPILDDWYRPILEVDFFALVGLSSAVVNSNINPNQLKEVPLCFESPEHYVDIFRPLVLEEFKAQLHSSYLEMSSLENVYYGSLSVLSVDRVDDFHLVRFAHDDQDAASGRSFSENDLVLLTKDPVQNSSHEIHMVGKVERRERDYRRKSSILTIRFYLQNNSARLNKARRFLIERSKWHGSCIMSITPQHREFQALSSIRDIPILHLILKPDSDSQAGEAKTSGQLFPAMQRILKSSFNEGQLQAIRVAVGSSKKDCSLSLIQGPPGTGKTRTIVAIVNCLLACLRRTKEAKSSQIDDLRLNNSSSVRSRTSIREPAAIAKAWQQAALAKQINKDTENNAKSTDQYTRVRVLICAQSNAAVDELVSRVSTEGLYNSDGNMYKPYLVRVGNSKSVHQNSLPCFIDTLVDQRLAEERDLINASKDTALHSSAVLRSNLEKLVDQIRVYEAKRANLADNSADPTRAVEDGALQVDNPKELSDAELGYKLKQLYEEKRQIYKILSTVQAQEKKAHEETRTLRNKLRKTVLREAEIVVATLSGCGGDLYEVCSESMSNHKFGNPTESNLFDAVIIDEAAQALEPATLIPLQLLKSRGTKCIMVGDPKQLPATVISNLASKFQFECSMFERLQKAGHPVTMLTKQYRMHPEISRFPSLYFYDGKLLNGEQMNKKSAEFHDSRNLGPYLFYDVIDGVELHGKNSGSMSLYNEREADAAVQLLRFFKARCPSEFTGGRIGIITPYKCQLSILRSRFSAAFGSSTAAEMDFNTVDGFQGREVDILILSTVRAAKASSNANGSSSSSIGFVADVRRMNVALTRAKVSLWILGNARTLQTNRSWAALIEDAKSRNLVVPIKIPYLFANETAPGSSAVLSHIREPSEAKRHEKVDRSGQHSLAKESKRRENSQSSVDAPIDKTKSGGRGEFSSREREPNMNKKVEGKYGSSFKRNPILGSGIRMTENAEVAVSERRAKYDKSRGIVHKREDSHLKNRTHGSKNSLPEHKSSGKLTQARKEAAVSDKNLEENVSKAGEPSDINRTERNLSASKAPTTVGKHNDLISKRKQQREAVDALLTSALLPSKKHEAPLKSGSVKRAPSVTSNANHGIQPLKRRKGPTESYKDAMED